MKKILMILFLIILLTGCTANYEIEIKNNSIKEELYVSETDKKLINQKDDLEQSFDDYAKQYGEDKRFHYYINTENMYLDDEEECVQSEYNDCAEYKREYISNDKETAFSLSTVFNFDEYKNSGIANDLFPGFNSTYDGRYLTITGGDNYNFINGYKNLNNINITIKSTYKVVETNLKNDSSGIYKININSKNKPQEKLLIKFDTQDESVEIVNTSPKLFVYIALAIVAILVIIFLIRFYIKYKESNEY